VEEAVVAEAVEEEAVEEEAVLSNHLLYTLDCYNRRDLGTDPRCHHQVSSFHQSKTQIQTVQKRQQRFSVHPYI
jgi:hypothetical protein